MNLLELMLKEEIEWPVGAEFAAQDGDDRRLNFYRLEPIKQAGQMWFISDDEDEWEGRPRHTLPSIANDWNAHAVTRGEYQAAGGWMKWDGGKRPVHNEQMVETKWSHGRTITDVFISQRHWEFEPSHVNIIAYRIIKQDEQGLEPFVSIEDAQECNAKHAATAKQPTPKGAGNPILGMVLADLTNRALEGREKYGEPLKAHNGRNALWDAYQEALDLAMYLRQLIEEQQDA